MLHKERLLYESFQMGFQIRFCFSSCRLGQWAGCALALSVHDSGTWGGAFLLVFLIFTLSVGMPLLLSEFVIGRSSQRNPIEGFQYLGGKKAYKAFGWLGNIAVFLLLSFYSVIGGWILIGIIIAVGDMLNFVQINDYGAAF